MAPPPGREFCTSVENFDLHPPPRSRVVHEREKVCFGWKKCALVARDKYVESIKILRMGPEKIIRGPVEFLGAR